MNENSHQAKTARMEQGFRGSLPEKLEEESEPEEATSGA